MARWHLEQDLALRALESLPKDSELYRMQLAHLSDMTRLRHEVCPAVKRRCGLAGSLSCERRWSGCSSSASCRR